MPMDKKKRTVLVTGFGPFSGHPKNASWEAVKELKNLEIEEECNIALIIEEIPVVYERVSSLVPKLWSEHDPMLVVHVGVSHKARCLTLESRAYKTGYVRLDVEEKFPEEFKSCGDAIEAEIDVRNICEDLNSCSSSNREEGCRAVVSEDAGRYLCEYIFRESLSIHPGRTIFVHVPDLGVYSSSKTAKGICDVIRAAVKQIDSNEEKGETENSRVLEVGGNFENLILTKKGDLPGF